MMYENRLATTPNPGTFFSAGAEALSSRVVDFEDGPIHLNDPSEGLLYQTWMSKVVNDQVVLSADNYSETVIFSAPSISDFSIAFNQNGQLNYCYVQEGTTYLYWYDASVSGYVTTNFGSTMRTPKVTLDDKRSGASGASDIIFAYIKISDNKLYFRQQRDRFQIERLLDAGPFISIERMYFNVNNALQFKLVEGDPNA